MRIRLSIFTRVALTVASLALSVRPAFSAKGSLRVFDSPAEALASLHALGPRVIGLGEYHEVEGAFPGFPGFPSFKVRSAIARFTDELLPLLVPPEFTDMVLETWVTEGACGKQEETVVQKVEQTTKRPETTESELVTLVKRGQKLGVHPHILSVTCAEYDALLDDKGEVDFERLLAKITELLAKRITQLLKDPALSPDSGVIVYGGALHNDLYPLKELRPYAYGRAIKQLTRGRYLEVDLYVPEYIERDARIPKEWWYKLLAQVPAGKTALVKRGPMSYILVFPRTPPPATVAPSSVAPTTGTDAPSTSTDARPTAPR